MKTLACSTLGEDCKFVAKGNTAKEVIEKMTNHAKQAHPDKVEEFKKMSEADLEAMMKDE